MLAALGLADPLRARLAAALADGVSEADLRETLIMVIPYAGYPRGLSALSILASVRSRGDESLPPSPRDADALRELGERTFRAVYGERSDAILARIGGWHGELPDWLLTEAYGRVLSRPGLPLADREVLAAALLTALDQPDQLQGHVRGGLRSGASPERLSIAVEVAARHVSSAVADRARDRLRREIG